MSSPTTVGSRSGVCDWKVEALVVSVDPDKGSVTIFTGSVGWGYR